MLELRPVRVATGEDSEGFLVFEGDALVAVVVRLSDQHEERAGAWYLEAAFGRLAVALNPVFDTLDEAETWIAGRLRY